MLVIYRMGTLHSQFFKLNPQKFFCRMVIASPRFFVAGGINIHLDWQYDPQNKIVRNLIASFGLRLIVGGLTHDFGRTLDIVLERHSENIPSTCVDS